MIPIVTSDEMYAIDREVTERIGISADSLMENAGQALFSALKERIPRTADVAVLAGAGNNGGDGFVVARMLKSYGYETDVWLVPPKEKVKGAARTALEVYERSGYSWIPYEGNEREFAMRAPHYDVIIDALLGIGVKGEVRSPYQEIIEQVNRSRAVVYAIDVPSGVPADGGDVAVAVRADVTFTIQCPKLGAYTFPAADYYGELAVVDIGIPPLVVKTNAACRFVWERSDVMGTMPKRKRFSHKGTYGKLLVVGGSQAMAGAVTLAAKAALRSGAGLVTMAVPETVYEAVANRVPEAMCRPWPAEGERLPERPIGTGWMSMRSPLDQEWGERKGCAVLLGSWCKSRCPLSSMPMPYFSGMITPNRCAAEARRRSSLRIRGKWRASSIAPFARWSTTALGYPSGWRWNMAYMSC